MGKWEKRKNYRPMCEALVATHPTEDLIKAKNFIESYLEYRKLEKLYDTYILGIKEALKNTGSGRIYVEYHIDGTETGRLSCSKYSIKDGASLGVSFHTLPRETKYDIRSLVIAPDGYDFITVDQKAMELRVLAHIANEDNMRQAFGRKEDLHTFTATLLFNKPAQEITKQQRQIAKSTSFLIVYGGGEFNLSETFSIPMSQATSIINKYKRIYPGIFSFMAAQHRKIRANRYAETIFGRRRTLPLASSPSIPARERALRQGFNFLIQSAASDILLCSLIGISNELKEKKLKSKIVASVHDSIELISPKNETNEVVEIIKKHMIEYPYIKDKFGIEFTVPFEIDISIGNSFGH